MLFRKFRDVCIYHKDPGAVKTAPFLKKKIAEASKKYTLPESERAISILRRYDLRSKGVQNSAATAGPLLMREMVYELLS